MGKNLETLPILGYLNYLKTYFHNVSYLCFLIFFVSVLFFFFQLSPISQLTEGTIEAKDVLGIYSRFEKLLGWLTCRQGSETVPYLPPVVCKVRQQQTIHAAFSQETQRPALCACMQPTARRGAGSHHHCCAGRGGRGVGSRSTGHGTAAPGAAAALVGPLLLGLLLLGCWVTVISVAGTLTPFCFGSNSVKLI